MEAWAATEVTPGAWTYTWTPGPSAVYEIWENGILLETTAAGVGTYDTDPINYNDIPPALEIHDTASGTAQSAAYPTIAHLQWRGVAGAAAYTVEHFKRFVATYTENGAGWYTFTTDPLVDAAVESYELIGLDVRGVGGVPVPLTVSVVCNPLPPDTKVTMFGGTLTVGAA